MSGSREELDQYLTAMTDGSLEQTITRVAVQFVPKVDEARKFLKEINKKHPLILLIGIQRIAQGHVAARAGSIESDPDGKLIFQVAENMNYSWPFLCKCLERARVRYSPAGTDVTAFLFKSPIYVEDRRRLVSQGVEAYLNGDFVKAIHTLVPQIEGLRTLLGFLGVPMSKPHRNQTMQLKNLNDILREERVKESLGEDSHLYLLVLLADGRGFNFRSDVCHGLVPAESFRQELADRVFRCVLTLGLLRKGATE